jgi:hypothetical protein
MSWIRNTVFGLLLVIKPGMEIAEMCIEENPSQISNFTFPSQLLPNRTWKLFTLAHRRESAADWQASFMLAHLTRTKSVPYRFLNF